MSKQTWIVNASLSALVIWFPLSFYHSLCSLVVCPFSSYISNVPYLALPHFPLPLALSLFLSLYFSPARLEDSSQERWAAMETFIAVYHHVVVSAQCSADHRRHRQERRGPALGGVGRHVDRFDGNQNNDNNDNR